eukprot:Clim_evm3s185 gene=Clim_evmTU3s185
MSDTKHTRLPLSAMQIPLQPSPPKSPRKSSSWVVRYEKYYKVCVAFVVLFMVMLLSNVNWQNSQGSDCSQCMGIFDISTGADPDTSSSTIPAGAESDGKNQNAPQDRFSGYAVPHVIDEANPRPAYDPTFGQLKEEQKSDLRNRDRGLLSKYYSSADSVMEWGVGESTTFAIHYALPRYTGVEGDVKWLEKIRKQSPAHFRFDLQDIGPVGSYSHPTDQETRAKWPFYSIGPLEAENEAFDVYLVDGRFRVACVFAAFWHATHHGKSPDDFVVLLHDFKKRQIQYGPVLQVSERVEGCCGQEHMAEGESGDVWMIVLRLKNGVTAEQLWDLWDEYKFVEG